MNRIYADFNATTPLGNGAKQWISKAMEKWGNPSSSHGDGRQANELIEESRRAVASAAQVSPLEVVFTSGGSEANTMALMGSYFTNRETFRLLTTSVEHSSIRDTALFLEKMGVPVEFI
ncbi:MAG: aminotransferase class V-fold PLP-dependent enzyme, partial [Chlamydiae bacterium]|nr:aminotransferase class V-fold PLP-dependent enzyme [Chlamydiota bacterium]